MQTVLKYLEEVTCVILKNYTSTPVRKRLSLSTKARRKTSQNMLVKETGLPDRVKSFREVDSTKDQPSNRLGFVYSIQNGLKKIKNLIKRRLIREETGLAGRKNGVRLQKEEMGKNDMLKQL